MRRRPGGVERGWDSLVAPRTKGMRPGGVERGWDSLVAPRTKGRRPGGVERGWDSLVAPRTKGRRPGGVEVKTENGTLKGVTIKMASCICLIHIFMPRV